MLGKNLSKSYFLADGAVVAAKIATDAVETAKVKDLAVTYPKFSADVKERQVKGWIKFNGEGVIAINDSYNVATIADAGTGYYTVTWDTDFANVDYAVIASALSCAHATPVRTTAPLTWAVGSVQIRSGLVDGSGNLQSSDETDISVIAIGDQ